MTKIRVLRLLEYTYDSVDTAVRDQERWQVQGVFSPNSRVMIKSVALPLDVLHVEETA